MLQAEQEKLLAYTAYVRQEYPQGGHPSRRAVKWLVYRLLRHTDFFYSTPVPESTDVLFLHHYAEEPRRLARLVSMLRSRNLVVRHEIFAMSDLFLKRRLCKPSGEVYPDLLWAAGHAAYLVRKYRPRVLVTLENDLVMAPFLKEAMDGVGTYVNLSHGVTPNAPWHAVIAYDYYFLFGRSSLEHLRSNPVRIGNTRGVLAGSPFTDAEDVRMEAGAADRRTLLFFSTHLPPVGSVEHIRRGSRLIMQWAHKNPQFHLLVKLHPLEDDAFVRGLSAGIPNVTVLEKSISMPEALARASLVLHTMSNAAIEAALAGRPSVVVNDSDVADDYLHLERYFLPRARTLDDLSQRVTETIEDYPHFVDAARRFYHSHIERLDSVRFIADQLVLLKEGEDLKGTFELHENLAALEDRFGRA